MANHMRFYYWISKIVRIEVSENKTYFTIYDRTANQIVFYCKDRTSCRRLATAFGMGSGVEIECEEDKDGEVEK